MLFQLHLIYEVMVKASEASRAFRFQSSLSAASFALFLLDVPQNSNFQLVHLPLEPVGLGLQPRVSGLEHSKSLDLSLLFGLFLRFALLLGSVVGLLALSHLGYELLGFLVRWWWWSRNGLSGLVVSQRLDQVKDVLFCYVLGGDVLRMCIVVGIGLVRLRVVDWCLILWRKQKQGNGMYWGSELNALLIYALIGDC